MDPRFWTLVMEELRILRTELEGGVQPSNPALASAVFKVVREMDRQDAVADASPD